MGNYEETSVTPPPRVLLVVLEEAPTARIFEYGWTQNCSAVKRDAKSEARFRCDDVVKGYRVFRQ